MGLHVEMYTPEAISRAKQGARDWLDSGQDGYPRTWEQETSDAARRGYEIYDHDFEAPPIAGYEALESDELAVRAETVVKHGCERVRFQSKLPLSHDRNQE